MKILVINSGSSSIKFQLFNMKTKKSIASGLAEKIGEQSGRLKFEANGKKIVEEKKISDHSEGLTRIIELLTNSKTGVIKNKSEIDAIGHRTVHGGEAFCQSVLIDDQVIAAMKKMIPLAPLHNPPNLTGIEVSKKLFGNIKQVAVFDTAFHQTMPPHAFRYAIPEELYNNNRIRRYGFHGTSHMYVSREAAKFLKKPIDEINVITIHIGNGASMTAIKKGKSIDTTMGMTPLEGLMMGTRSGDIDPAIPYFLATNNNMEIEQIDQLLNKQSGMKGITGNNDLREIEDRYIAGDDPKATLGLTMYAYRIKKYIGAYYAALGTLDAIIFTAGVGENSDIIRGMVCEGLDDMGISIDQEKNKPRENFTREIQKDTGKIKILVVPTNEELEIANQTFDVLS